MGNDSNHQSDLWVRNHPRVKGRRLVKSHIYDCLHVSLLHAKVAMITDVKTNVRLMWENGRDARVHSSWHRDLCTEQVLPNKSGGQMLVTNFSD